MDGDWEILREVVDIYVETTPSVMEEIAAALSRADADGVRNAAHNLKGASSNICAEGIRETAAMIEQMAIQGELDTVGDDVANLRAQMDD